MEKSLGGTPQKPAAGVQQGIVLCGCADLTDRVIADIFSRSGMDEVQTGVPKSDVSWLIVLMIFEAGRMSARIVAVCRAQSHLPGPTSI